jgi:diguanylate cyclase (GGDEF)-like protein
LNVARDTKALFLVRRGTIVNLNRLAADLCGRSFDDVNGQSIAELLEDASSSSAVESWQTGLKAVSGTPIAVEVTRQQLNAGEADIQVYAVRDLRERHAAAELREQLNARLAEQHEQLDAALANMLQGLAMFDAEQRLIICNQRYADMYGLTPEQVKPGTTVRQILQYRIANGFYHVRDTERFVDSWVGAFGEVSSRIQELVDGRIINVTRRSMANGGRLVTHDDITERQKLHDRLEEQHNLVAQQNMRFKAALDNMGEGLCMFDADKRLVVCNDRYAKMYQLPPELLEVGTPHSAIIAHRVSRGILKGDTGGGAIEQKISTLGQLPADAISSRTDELADGRLVCVTRQPMPGGGWVATHNDVTQQRRSEAKIAHMALHDGLTGLPNRTLLNERLEHALARTGRGAIVATHILDLDHFKHVNDTLGHAVGDKLLQMVGQRLQGLVRDADTMARMGGDEFAIVQVDLTLAADASALAQRVITAISEPYDIDGHLVVTGTSVGIAVAPTDGSSADQLMKNADLALYRAKTDGRGTSRFFEPGMDAQVRERRELEHDLRGALAAGGFELHYQPIVDLASGRINAFEALIRWHHPDKGMVPPARFIPLAEETGLIVPIGEWVIRQACATAAPWPADIKIAVNLSPAQLKSAGLLQAIVSALAVSGLAASRLELEITETVLLHDSEATLATLYQLRALGVHIAMDDFGTGYSSLSHLQRFPFDKIKIDRSFINNITDNASSLNIVRAVAALAGSLGVAATAEGVENQEQLDAIRSEGCTEMQGFLLSKPIPAHLVSQLLVSKQIGHELPMNVAAS